MPEPRASRPGRSPAGFAVLAVLALVAAGVLFKQSVYDPGPYRPPGPEATAGAPAPAPAAAPLPGPSADVGACLPPGGSFLNEPERFDAYTLADKIDGKAELYLPAGFRSLEARRFTLPGAGADAWAEVFLYDMGGPYGAYAVYSAQKRSTAVAADVGDFSYTTENGLYVVRGPWYLEFVASERGDAVREELLAAARACVPELPGEPAVLPELDLFPADGMDAGGVVLLAADAFGFSGFDHVFLATYTRDGTELTGYVSRRKSPEEARELARSYHAFLLANGAKDAPAGDVENALAADLFGIYEIVWHKGRWTGGVHGAEARGPARALSVELARNVPKE